MALSDKEAFDLNELFVKLAVSKGYREEAFNTFVGDAIQELGENLDSGIGGSNLDETSLFRVYVITGADASMSAQQVTTTGTKIGDKVLWILNLTDGALATEFESTITVDDKIVQNTTDLTTKKFFLVVLAKS